ncbi:glycosyltransferase family 8 protein [Mycena galopus ATCC 62051]|nr:glycosyltransferase family 8 protein [Mycena galopus ATCC 62051]
MVLGLGLAAVAFFVPLFLVLLYLWRAAAELRRLGPPYNPLDHYQNINPLPVTSGRTDLSPSTLSRRALVSSLYSDGFAIAVAVVGYSARSANVSARLLLPYLEHKVSPHALCIARAVGWEPYAVPLIPPPHGGYGTHPSFAEQYTKLNMWRLDQQGVDRVVYLDADTLVRRNFDELFEGPFNFAAVPDVYYPGHPQGFSMSFNAGMLAFRTSSVVYENLRAKMEVADYPFQQAEQAFLNLYFGGTALRLPYIYNGNLALKARSPVLWQRLTDEMRVVHYTTVKPFKHDTRPSEFILTPEEMEEAMEQSLQREGGYFPEEVAWWKAAYRAMMVEYGDVIRQCKS